MNRENYIINLNQESDDVFLIEPDLDKSTKIIFRGIVEHKVVGDFKRQIRVIKKMILYYKANHKNINFKIDTSGYGIEFAEVLISWYKENFA
jgi:hypothetical protein